MGPIPASQPTYSGSAGPTVTGQQVQNGVNQNLTAAQSSVSSGQSLPPQAVAALNQGYTTANQNYVGLNTPGQRQQTLDQTTNLSGLQGNYDSIAQQLAAYDKTVLQPQFAGQNPGMPTDLPYTPNLYFGDISYNSPNTGGGVYNANPLYGMQAQGMQKNAITDVLNLLNETMGKELQKGKDIYGGKLSSAASILKGYSDILDKNMTLEMTKAQLQNAKDIAGMNNRTSIQSALIQAGILPPGTTGDIGLLPNDRQSYQQAYYSALNPKIKDSISQKWESLHPGSSLFFTDAQKSDATELTQALDDIKSARSALAVTGSGPQYAGFGMRSQIPNGYPLSIDKTTADTNTLFSQLNARLFNIAGKQFTGPEQQIIGGLRLDLGKNVSSNTSALDQAEKRIQDKLNIMTGTSNPTPGTSKSFKVGNYSVEVQ